MNKTKRPPKLLEEQESASKTSPHLRYDDRDQGTEEELILPC